MASGTGSPLVPDDLKREIRRSAARMVQAHLAGTLPDAAQAGLAGPVITRAEVRPLSRVSTVVTVHSDVLPPQEFAVHISPYVPHAPNNPQQEKRRQKRLKAELSREAHHHGQPWTGSDLEIALDYSLTAAGAARRLGRSYEAVREIRRKEDRTPQEAAQRKRLEQKNHATLKKQNTALAASGRNHRQPWSADDREIALDLSLTAREAAARLGRSREGVQYARRQERRRREERSEP